MHQGLPSYHFWFPNIKIYVPAPRSSDSTKAPNLLLPNANNHYL
jgi:hypothetical protein